MPPKTPPNKDKTLEDLLRRGDVWRGHSQYFTRQLSCSSGYEELDKALLNNGWPLGAMIEVGLPVLEGFCEWHLLLPVIQGLKADCLVLLNPPALPFAHRLIQMGVDLDRLLVVHAHNKADFLSGFIELSQSPSCALLLAWQPKQALSYTELRKCLLASADNSAMQILFRHQRSLQNSSPAALRLLCSWQSAHLQVSITKQKGLLLKQHNHIQIPLPESWPKPEEFQNIPEPQRARAGATVINFKRSRASTHSTFTKPR